MSNTRITTGVAAALLAITFGTDALAQQALGVEATVSRSKALNVVLADVMAQSPTAAARACAGYLNLIAFTAENNKQLTILKDGTLIEGDRLILEPIVRKQIVCALAMGKLAKIVVNQVASVGNLSDAELRRSANSAIQTQFPALTKAEHDALTSNPFKGPVRYSAGGFGQSYSAMTNKSNEKWSFTVGDKDYVAGQSNNDSDRSIGSDEMGTYASRKAHVTPTITVAQASLNNGMQYSYDNGRVTIRRSGVTVYDQDTLDGEKYSISLSLKNEIQITR